MTLFSRDLALASISTHMQWFPDILDSPSTTTVSKTSSETEQREMLRYWLPAQGGLLQVNGWNIFPMFHLNGCHTSRAVIKSVIFSFTISKFSSVIWWCVGNICLSNLFCSIHQNYPEMGKVLKKPQKLSANIIVIGNWWMVIGCCYLRFSHFCTWRKTYDAVLPQK